MPASPSPASNTKSSFRTVPPRRAISMGRVRRESTASILAIAKSRFPILTKSLGTKNNSFSKRVNSSSVIEFRRGSKHGRLLHRSTRRPSLQNRQRQRFHRLHRYLGSSQQLRPEKAASESQHPSSRR